MRTSLPTTGTKKQNKKQQEPRPAVALVEILSVFEIRAAILAYDEFCQGRIGIADLDRILQLLFIDKHQRALPF
jgi:hypothetical protein